MKNNNTPTRQPNRQAYPTDLTDTQWAFLEPLFVGMRTYKWSKRELLDAVLYLVDSGCKWRELPHDFPPFPTVWSFYRRARFNGLWEHINDALVAETRRRAGKSPEPTVAIIDSRSVRTVYRGEAHGTDGGKNERAQTSCRD